MQKLSTLITEHKKGALVALFLVIVFVGGSVASAFNVAAQRAQESAQQAEQPQEEGTDASVSAQSVDLTDSQQAAVDAYDDETNEFIDTLCASVWTANGGRNSLLFERTQYSESVDGEVTVHPYAILRLDTSSDTAGAMVNTVVFETDTGVHVATYVYSTGNSADDSGEIATSLESATMFASPNMTYERQDAVKSITITGLNSEVTSLLGDDPQELTDELSNWCSVHYPSVTEAAWDGTAFIDYTNSLVTTSFTLNNEFPVNVSVIYHTDSGTFELTN